MTIENLKLSAFQINCLLQRAVDNIKESMQRGDHGYTRVTSISVKEDLDSALLILSDLAESSDSLMKELAECQELEAKFKS